MKAGCALNEWRCELAGIELKLDDMLPSDRVAGLIASMLQGNRELGPVWDALDRRAIAWLISTWTREIRLGGEAAVETIVESLAIEPKLTQTWERCGAEMREHLKFVMRRIITSEPINPAG